MFLHGDFSNFDLPLKLVCFGTNDVTNILGFQNWCYNVVEGKQLPFASCYTSNQLGV
jgi:hypothetical protein